MRRVAVFDSNLPTGLAFIRSLGRAGVPVVAFSHDPNAMGRRSRYVKEFRMCPDPARADQFSTWLAEELQRGTIDLVAPTSDFVAFGIAEAAQLAKISSEEMGGQPQSNLLDCLFKNRFATAMGTAGFPSPVTSTPTSLDEAIEDARRIGYPVVVKPRSHVGVGVARGNIAWSENELPIAFAPYEIGSDQSLALRHDSDLAWPIVQKYMSRDDVDVMSVAGCIGRKGELLAVTHSLKTNQWPSHLGVGTRFEVRGAQVFTKHAIEAVSRVLGSGIFEFEVLFDRRTKEYWAIDLNPRAFGHITLDIACGHDLPILWYRSVTQAQTDELLSPPLGANRPTAWFMGVPYATEQLIDLVRRPGRGAALAALVDDVTARSVGAVHDSRDPLPGLAWALAFLSHPGGLVRPMFHPKGRAWDK